MEVKVNEVSKIERELVESCHQREKAELEASAMRETLDRSLS